MKTLLSILLIIGATFTFAQDCTQYFPLKEGVSFEQTNYNPKGKMQSVSYHKIVNTKHVEAGIEANISAQVKDDKSKNISSMDYVVQCKNGELLIDLKNFVPTEQLEQYKEMEVEISEGFSTFPANPKVGDKLDDITVTIKASSSGIVIMDMTIIVSDRVITGSEKITTPTGTYECLVVNQNTTLKMGGIMPMTRTSSSIDWIAKNIGLVKSEAYDKNKKMQSYTLLTKFSN